MIFGHPAVHVPAVAGYPPLDAFGLILYTLLFIAVTLATMRRPAYGVCTLIAVQPFALYQAVSSTTITLSKVAILGVLLGLFVYRDAFAPFASKVPRRLLWAAILVLAATLLSYVHAAYHAPVMRESFKMAEYIVLFCAGVAAYRMDPDRELVRRTVITVGIVVGLAALSQELIGAPSGLWINGHVIPRIAGPLEGPNQLAGYFDIALPLTLALTMERPYGWGVFALAVMALADFLTFSRGGLIAVFIALLIVALVWRRNVRVALAPLVTGVVAGLAIAAAWAFSAHSGAGAAFRLSGDESDYAGGVGTRRELWHAAVQLWRAHPIFGVGAGNFEREIPLTGLEGVRTHANSLYLQSLVEGGIPLLLATLWLVYNSIAAFARDKLRSPFVLAAFAGSIALALHQVVDFLTFYPKVGGEWWIVLALGAAELAATAPIRQQAQL